MSGPGIQSTVRERVSKVWFVRSNGRTGHADPGTADFVEGEPSGLFDYRGKCLAENFARVGWPNTGDLREPGLGRMAPNGYTIETLDPGSRRLLEQFRTIQVGDIVVIPAGREKYDVHVGLVVRRSGANRDIDSHATGPAYYYAPATPYECAHRVDIRWASDASGGVAVFHCPGLPWRPAFGRVRTARSAVLDFAKNHGL